MKSGKDVSSVWKNQNEPVKGLVFSVALKNPVKNPSENERLLVATRDHVENRSHRLVSQGVVRWNRIVCYLNCLRRMDHRMTPSRRKHAGSSSGTEAVRN